MTDLLRDSVNWCGVFVDEGREWSLSDRIQDKVFSSLACTFISNEQLFGCLSSLVLLRVGRFVAYDEAAISVQAR